MSRCRRRPSASGTRSSRPAANHAGWRFRRPSLIICLSRNTEKASWPSFGISRSRFPTSEKAAAFYEGAFDLKRVNQVDSPIGNAIALSDGIVNLTLLHFPEGTKGGKGGPDWAGLHHIGFIVDDEKKTAEKIEHLGGEFFMELPNYPGVDAEKKFKDPDGIVFDVGMTAESHHS